ncbi:protein zer-1 homolog [Amphiura filiformis]|uniref:protein zer-1 homolog n=1 Tax=Amphiura filiformis TaxID=82378 RepID=UPI003B2139E4
MAGGDLEEDSPCPLTDTVINYCISNVSTFCDVDSDGKPVRIRDDAYLPSIICDRMVSTLSKQGAANDDMVRVFCDPSKTKLQRVNLSQSPITNESIHNLSNHKLVELDVSNCALLTEDCLRDILTQKNLQVLNISGCSRVLQKYGFPLFDFPLQKLRSLNIGFIELSATQLHLLLQHLPRLTSVDLSKVIKNGDLACLNIVKDTLKSLVIHDCVLVAASLEYIYQLSALRHLDISVNDQEKLPLTNEILKQMVKSLPCLSSLDISGNTMVYDDDEEDQPDSGFRPKKGKHSDKKQRKVERMQVDKSFGDRKDEDDTETSPINEHGVRSSLEGLRGLTAPLQFLGLLGMEECELEYLPAVRVTGLANEEQILNVIDVYHQRRDFLLKGLNAYFDLLRVIECFKPVWATKVILVAMKRYPKDNQVQISGSASLYHLTRGLYKKHMSIHLKQQIIIVLLTAIENITESVTLLRNCGLTLFNFSIPGDFQFQFERVVKNLVKLALTEDRDGLLQRIYVHMCNSIVCHVEGDQKKLVGKLGIVRCMLQLISDRLEKEVCDEVLETAWSTLWNVTDETSENCEMFLDGNGMNYFLQCRSTFQENPELLRNMMGLIGNVAEVQRLRPQLLAHADVFIDLLSDRSDGIEVSYNAAGTLSHILSDGPEAWTIDRPTRGEVLLAIIKAIDSWTMDTKRNINYRSFEPILRLLPVYHTPEVQYWAVWALANLCTVLPNKYCNLLEKEGGLDRLKAMRDNPRTSEEVKRLIKVTLDLAIGKKMRDVLDV